MGRRRRRDLGLAVESGSGNVLARELLPARELLAGELEMD